MDEFRNPYRPGAGTNPPALLGRDQLLAHFGIALRRARDGRPGKSLMAIGLRGVGKTVLLNRFVAIAEREGFTTSFLEAPESGEFRSQLAGHLRRSLLAFDSQRKTAKVLRALRVLKAFTLQLPEGWSVSLDVDALAGSADSGNLQDDVTELFTAVGAVAAEREAGILFAVDEVQYLDEVELGALITAIHRTTQLDLPIVLVGAGLPQLPGIAGKAKSYAERLFEFPHIGALEPHDARAAIEVPAAQRGVAFATDALEAIVQRAQGYPYFLQEWGYQTWNESGPEPISLAIVESVASRVQDHLDANFFRVRFDRLTPAEKRYLGAMARLGPGPHRSGDIAGQLGLKVESVAPRRSGLISKGMIYSPAHGDTAFTVPVFDEFLRRVMPDPSPDASSR